MARKRRPRDFGDRFSDPYDRGRSGKGGYEAGQPLSELDAYIRPPGQKAEIHFNWAPVEGQQYPLDRKQFTELRYQFLEQIWPALRFTSRRWGAKTLYKNQFHTLEAYLEFTILRLSVAEILTNPQSWPIGYGVCIQSSGEEPALAAYRAVDDVGKIIILQEIEAEAILNAIGPQPIKDVWGLRAFVDHVPIGFMKGAGEFDDVVQAMRQAARSRRPKPWDPRHAILVVNNSPRLFRPEAGAGETQWVWESPRPRVVSTAAEYAWLWSRLLELPPPHDLMLFVMDGLRFTAPTVSSDWSTE